MSDITEDQIAHRERILDAFVRDFRQKYDRGQRQHGGNLWERVDLIDWAIEEALDQVAFLYSLREQLSHAYLPPVRGLQEAYEHNRELPPHEPRPGPDGEP